MREGKLVRSTVLVASVAVVAGLFVGVASVSAAGGRHQYLVQVGRSADYSEVRSKATSIGATVVRDLRQIGRVVVSATSSQSDTLASDSRVTGVAQDHISSLGPPESAPRTPAGVNVQNVSLGSASQGVSATAINFTPDPAFGYSGNYGNLMWNYYVDGAAGPNGAWNATIGDPNVKVGVADTGLDYTHSELASQVYVVKDFTTTEDPPLCKTFFGGIGDDDLAKSMHAPVDGDFYGHGTWIGGGIAAAADGKGINGIAPSVKLASLKISQWCGSAYDSTILDAFLYAADHGISLVNISFGGYLDGSDPGQVMILNAYRDAVAYAKNHGTTIVAAAGNEHTRVGANGKVTIHGTLTIPGDELFDAYGLYEVPGGTPGVVDVSSVGNEVAAPSDSCPSGTTGPSATCKPLSDAHDSYGVGDHQQLTYYSNWGTRIDVAGPGGARKFNVPNADRGGTQGWPYTTADGYSDFEDFGITSNFATQIDCFKLNSTAGFPKNQCYTSIQGTSMAAPQAVGVLALILSANPGSSPDTLLSLLKSHAVMPSQANAMPGLSATDTSGGDRTGGTCPTGYCHLGGPAIVNSEVYGAGIVNAAFLAA
jgi:subtilisin family serine protease